MKEIYNETGVFKCNEEDKIFIIGDIHGDYQCLIHCLVDLCKVCYINKIYDDNEFNTKNRENLKWKKGNNSVIVFCGDLIDRKRFDNILDDECSDIFILKTLLRLKKEAIENKGNIIIISGNHEIMNIVNIEENLYVSPANLSSNHKYFKDSDFINNYVANSYAWIKINDILIAHGGLCSDYLKFLDNKIDSKKIISFVNSEYRKFFKDYNDSMKNNKENTELSNNLFINYDLINKSTHNIFWCREWGYGKINCDKLKTILKQVDCEKMIISHCPQFLSPNDPKMINFECLSLEKESTINNEYLLARIDLGMSRSFDYNIDDNKFLDYLSNNYNRKISVLQLSNNNNKLYFNKNGIITYKLSCIQYLLLKYGITFNEWTDKKINSNWVGFKYINNLLDTIKNKNDNVDINCKKSNNVLLCLLYEIYMKNIKLESIDQFNNYN